MKRKTWETKDGEGGADNDKENQHWETFSQKN